MMTLIASNFNEVENRIREACNKAGRNRSDVKLIVVTKKQPVEKIQEVILAGGTDLGENYPEEAVEKILQVGQNENVHWHMIGHLQSRKIKILWPHFSLIHSVDSLELVEKIDRYYQTREAVCDILLEVNFSGEQTKFGFDGSDESKRDGLIKIFEQILSLRNIQLRGLMTMPPYALQPDQNTAYYMQCQEMLAKINQKLGMMTCTELSMGTSADFENAIVCGATYVRVGEAIMGKRK